MYLIVDLGLGIYEYYTISVFSNDIVCHFRTGESKDMEVPFEAYYWNKPSGAPIERKDLMVALTNVEGIYIRASYGVDSDAQVRLSKVALDSAREVPGDRNMTAQDIADQVTSVELCQCPPGYHGYSCEDCDLGYYESDEGGGDFGPICKKCDCNNHADICHPKTGECVTLTLKELTIPDWTPKGDDPENPDPEIVCHFRPDLCVIDEGEVSA